MSWYLLLYQSAEGYYFKLRINQLTLFALAANFCWFSAATWVLVRLLRLYPNRWFHLAVDLLFFAVLLLPAEFLRIYWLKIPDYRLVSLFLKPQSILLVVGFVVLLVWQHRCAAHIVGTCVGVLAPLAVFTLCKMTLLFAGLHTGPQASTRVEFHPAPLSRKPQPPIIWLIFDEFDYRLAFEKPLPRLNMPEFERLRKEAVFATNAVPPADDTLASIPALTTGKLLKAVEIANPSDLKLTCADTGQMKLWTALPSVFSEAGTVGINTAIVGWYHPYDRVFGTNVNYCSWQPIMGLEAVGSSTSFAEAFKRQIACLACTPYSRYMYAELCRQSIADSLAAVTNRAFGLMFFHLPPPHRPGIYNPEKESYTVLPVPKPRAYRNNLMLADRVLGSIRRELESSGDWERTWLIVSSDHSWRESKIVDGRRDLRVPFLLKSAGANQPVIYSPKMNTVVTRDLVLGIIRGAVTNQTSVVSWLDANRNDHAPILDSATSD